MFVEVEIECIVLYDAIVPQIFDIDEVAFELEDVLWLHGDFFDCVDFIGFEVLAGMDGGVAALADFGQELVLLEEGVEVATLFLLVLV